MNTLELNKIVGAVLVAALSATVISQIGNILVPSGREAAPHGEAAAPAETGAPARPTAPEKPMAVLLQSASAEEGEKVAKACIACHTFEEGGPNKVGPNLWNVVGRPKASHEGFAYSSALESLGGEWTYEDLYEFVANPSAYARGTKMTFRLSNAERRADLLAYLRTLSDDPKPLPQPTEEELQKAQEPAEGAAETEAEQGAAPAGQQPPEPAQEAMRTEAEQPVEELLASASVENGEKVAKRCVACHDLSKDAKNKVGPPLWNIVGRDKASVDAYNYSTGTKALEGEWTYKDLFEYLANPQAMAKGSKMTFKLPKPGERADIIAYLRTLSDNPEPLPNQ